MLRKRLLLVTAFGAQVTRPMVMPIDDAGNIFGADNAMLNGQAGLTVSALGGARSSWARRRRGRLSSRDRTGESRYRSSHTGHCFV